MFREQRNDMSVDKDAIYTFVFNSLYGTKTNALTANEVSYNVDWSVIPDQKYKVHLCYMGEVNNLDGARIAQVHANFGTPTNVYQPLDTTTRTATYSSQFLGFLEMYLLGANAFLHAEDGTNSPIQINGRPRDDTFTIRVLDNNQPAALFTPTSGNMGDYILTLKFIPLGSSS
jgi:hypothetical protein